LTHGVFFDVIRHVVSCHKADLKGEPLEIHVETEIQKIRALRECVKHLTDETKDALHPRGASRYPVYFLKLSDIGMFIQSMNLGKEAEFIDPDCDCRFCQTQPLITLK